MRVRPATPHDAESIAAAHVTSWRATYRGVVPDQVLDGPEVLPDRQRLWQRLLGRDAPTGHGAWVAEDASGVVGVVGVAPSWDDDAGPSTGQVTVVYCIPDVWGTGVGRALMSTALDALRAGGSTEVTLWVLDRNERARRFYVAAGFAADGATKSETLAGVPVTTVRYRRDL